MQITNKNNQEITATDFLAGGGGVTEAMVKLGLNVKSVLNHDPMAIRANLFNHGGIKHYLADFYKQNEKELEPTHIVWASIECTQHSRANGGRKKKIGSYTMAWELVRYLEYMQPFVIGIENVPEFKKWSPVDNNGDPIKGREGEEFEKWKKTICDLGYNYSENINNAADYGLPTRRKRFFCFFTKKELNMNINWPASTHNKKGTEGKKKWVACREYIDLTDEGQSIFGRELNPNIKKGKRKPLVKNTLKRIAGGIKKQAPDLYFILQYYGSGLNTNKLNEPLNTVTTKDRHLLVKVEKMNFLVDHCHQDISDNINEPISPILTREEKRLVTIKGQFLADYYGREDTSQCLNAPANTITTENSKHLVTIKSNFLTHQYNSNGRPESNSQSLNEPLKALATEEKVQFITAYFSANGRQDTQNQSLDAPLNSITTGANKQALVTAINQGLIDFDIKVRFLHPEELAQISTFPEKYFGNSRLNLSRKDQVKLIGNAVPPKWAEILLKPVVEELKEKLKITSASIYKYRNIS